MTQSVLLDTCACIWLLEGTLSATAHGALVDAHAADVTSFVSPVTALEIATLSRKRRAKSPLDPQRWFSNVLSQPGLALSAMPPAVLMASQFLPDYADGDPFDRIIAATAREYGYTVMTRDAALLDYGRRGYLAVLEC